jgi:hypothetical protein
MRITIDVHRSPTGHLAGSVEEGGRSGSTPFHGILELVSAIEQRLDAPPAGRQDPDVAASEDPRL